MIEFEIKNTILTLKSELLYHRCPNSLESNFELLTIQFGDPYRLSLQSGDFFSLLLSEQNTYPKASKLGTVAGPKSGRGKNQNLRPLPTLKIIFFRKRGKNLKFPYFTLGILTIELTWNGASMLPRGSILPSLNRAMMTFFPNTKQALMKFLRLHTTICKIFGKISP